MEWASGDNGSAVPDGGSDSGDRGGAALAMKQPAAATSELRRVLVIAEQVGNHDVVNAARELLQRAGDEAGRAGGAED